MSRQLIRDPVMNFVRTLFAAWPRSYTRLNEQDIDRATNMVVDGTDPRLRMISGYKRKLRKPIIRSLVHVDRLVQRLPGPYEISRKAFAMDPQVNALFATADAMQDVFSQSDMLRKFFADSPGSDLVYATMGMHKNEKQQFGMELQGDIVRKEVAQQVVSFAGHRIGVYGQTEDEVREWVRWRGIQSLAASALESITEMKVTTHELQERRALLSVKLSEIKAQCRGLDALAESRPEDEAAWETTQRHLEETEQQLQEARASLGTMDDYLRQVCKVLTHPTKHLRAKSGSVHLDRMGVMVKEGNQHRGAKVVTTQVTLGKQPSYEAVLVSYPRAEMRDQDYYRSRARPYLHAL